MEVLESTAVLNMPCPTEQEQAFTALYEQAFLPVAKFVSKMGGTFSDAKDIFHDAFIIFYEKQAHNQMVITVSKEAYLLGIAKHLWLRKFKQDTGKAFLDETEQNIAIPPDYFNEKNNRLAALLQISGRKCLKLLQAFYYDNLKPKDIARSFGFRTERSATVQKYKCLEKVRNKVKEKSLSYADLVE